jgi:hypothetical protein
VNEKIENGRMTAKEPIEAFLADVAVDGEAQPLEQRDMNVLYLRRFQAGSAGLSRMLALPGLTAHRRRLARTAVLVLLAGSLLNQVPPVAKADANTPTTSGVYPAWLDTQRRIARSEGRIRDLQKQQAEIEHSSGVEGAPPATAGAGSGQQDQTVAWQRDIDAERQRLSRLRDDLERLGRLLP